ncbi:MAG TPA: hypothetical protein VKD90_05330 [Gemmataceae bacterium]|nr:hypothetical protein [Gemmataceae bacterium]
MRSAIEQAAGEIRRAMTADGKVEAVDWLLITDLVRDLVWALIVGCAPTPAAGYAYLTREFGPIERLFGAERRRERRIRRAVADHWRGSAQHVGEVQAAVLSGIGRRLSRLMMDHLYAECGEVRAERT